MEGDDDEDAEGLHDERGDVANCDAVRGDFGGESEFLGGGGAGFCSGDGEVDGGGAAREEGGCYVCGLVEDGVVPG